MHGQYKMHMVLHTYTNTYTKKTQINKYFNDQKNYHDFIRTKKNFQIIYITKKKFKS